MLTVTVLLVVFPLALGLDKILVATGRGAENDVELIAFPSSASQLQCSKPQFFPQPTEGAVGGLVDDNVPILCGGRFGQFAYSSCFILDKENGNWFPTFAMSTKRGYAASANTEAGFWVTGGRTAGDTGVTVTTELYSDGLWRSGPPLAQGVSGHCQAHFTGGRTIVVGGDTETEFFLSNARLFDWAESAWTELPEMVNGRSQTACGIFKDGQDEYLVVAGGYGTGSTKLSSVELLDSSTLTWSEGPPLPVTSAGARLVEDGVGGLFLVGADSSGSVYSYMGKEDGWRLEDEHLVIGSRLFAVVYGVDDAHLFDCQ